MNARLSAKESRLVQTLLSCVVSKSASYAFIGAGAVVTRNVADYALVVGVPGRQIGWMSRHGYRLKFDDDGNAVCPESGIRYVKRGNMVLEYE